MWFGCEYSYFQKYRNNRANKLCGILADNCIGATFLGQVIDQVTDDVVFDPADQSCLLALLTDHAGRFQVAEVVGQGGARDADAFLNLPDR